MEVVREAADDDKSEGQPNYGTFVIVDLPDFDDEELPDFEQPEGSLIPTKEEPVEETPQVRGRGRERSKQRRGVGQTHTAGAASSSQPFVLGGGTAAAHDNAGDVSQQPSFVPVALRAARDIRGGTVVPRDDSGVGFWQ
jgi:hypothetical protein